MMDNPQSVEQVLASEGKYVSTTVGTSMLPLFRNRKDTVIISPVHERLKKYDVPLYRRGDKLILHRIIGVTDKGYVIRGDNCEGLELDITDENIIGVMTEFYRKDKHYSASHLGYKLYSRIHVFLFPIRKLYLACRRKAASIYRHIIKKQRP